MPEAEQSPNPSPNPADDLKALLREAVKEAVVEATAPLQKKLDALEEENKSLKSEVARAVSVAEFEAANVNAPQYTGVYRGRPDSARHVTLATRAAREAPELYDHVTGGVPATPRNREE